MKLDHLKMTRDHLARRIGAMRQFARIETATLDDGKGRGVRVARVVNGSGLDYDVLLDRGMDIGAATYKGVPLAYVTPVGYCHPAYYEKDGSGWLRTWGAGLMTGCGLRNVGAPDARDDENLGLHGRLSHLPAENVCREECWDGDRYRLSLRGQLREVRVFGEHLLLTRSIETVMGESRIVIRDRVENQGVNPSRVMLLYHVNVGYPVLDDVASLSAVDHKVEPRDADAASGLDAWSRCQEPTADYAQQCFYHDIPADADGFARMTLSNSRLGLAFDVAYRKAELPFLTQWKQMGEGDYVMGVEPANCHVEGVNREDEFKTLRTLEPSERVETMVVLSVREL